MKSRSQSVRKGIVLLLVNLRWTQLSENFLLIRKDPSAISEKRQPLEKNFPFKLEICYEERLEILQEEICNFEESFLLLEPSQTLRYFLQRYEKNFSNILNLVLFQTLEPSRIATRALKIQRRKFHRRKATRLRHVSSKHRYSPWKNRPAFNYLVDPVCSTIDLLRAVCRRDFGAEFAPSLCPTFSLAGGLSIVRLYQKWFRVRSRDRSKRVFIRGYNHVWNGSIGSLKLGSEWVETGVVEEDGVFDSREFAVSSETGGKDDLFGGRKLVCKRFAFRIDEGWIKMSEKKRLEMGINGWRLCFHSVKRWNNLWIEIEKYTRVYILTVV